MGGDGIMAVWTGDGIKADSYISTVWTNTRVSYPSERPIAAIGAISSITTRLRRRHSRRRSWLCTPSTLFFARKVRTRTRTRTRAHTCVPA